MKDIWWVVAIIMSLSMLTATGFEVQTTVYRDASNGQGVGSGLTPATVVDTVNSKIITVTANVAEDGKAWLTICDFDGLACVDSDASNGQGLNSGSVPSLAIDTANDKVVIAAQNNGNSGKLWLYICNLDGTACTDHDATGTPSGPISGDPSVAIDTVNAKIIVASRNGAASNRLWLHICNLDGSGCSHHDASNGQGPNSGLNPSLAIDTVNAKAVIATRNSAQGTKPWLNICDLDGTGCTNHDASAGEPNDSGALVAMAIDTVNSAIIIATRNIPRNSKPWLFICTLQGTLCTNHDASAGQGALSGTNPRVVIDPLHAKVLVVAKNEGQSFTPWLYVCNLNGTGCSASDASAGLTYSSFALPSLAVIPSLSKIFIATPVTANNTLALNIASPFVPLGCPTPVIPNGDLTIRFNFPDWNYYTDAATCAPGYSPVGATSGVCGSGSSTWTPGLPQCVFNVSSLLLEFPQTVIVANETVTFLLTDVDGTPGTDPGASIPSVRQQNGDLVSSLSFEYLNGEYAASFQVPTGVGSYEYLVFLSGQFVSDVTLSVVPAAFAGVVSSPAFSNTSGVLTAVFETPTSIRVVVEDAFGNGIVYSPGALGSRMTVDFVTGGATTLLELQAVERGDGLTYDAVYTLRPVFLGSSELIVRYNGASVPCACGVSLPAYVVNVVCPSGFQKTGATCVPTPCNADSVNVAPAGTKIPECVCDTGFTFAKRDNNSIPVCARCPEGAVCARGLESPIAAPGFFPSSDGTFIRCRRAAACRGGVNPCSTGYEGYMCNTCQRGYYSNSAGDCASCPPSARGILSGALVIAVGLGVGLAVLVALGVKTAGKVGEDEGSVRARTLPSSFAMILATGQVIGLISSANFGWSDSAQKTLNVFNAANVDVNLFASECALSSFYVKYAFSIGLPLLLIVLALATMMAFKIVDVFGMGDVGLWALVDSVAFAVAPLVYIPMARATFVVFDCTRLPNGDYVLNLDPGVACFDSAWWSVAWMGMVSVAGFVVGIPVYFFVCVYRQRDRLMDTGTYVRYGALYRLYRIPYFWGSVADLGKRLSIVLASVFVSEHVLVQIGLMLLVFLASSYVINKLQPFYYPLYNDLEFRLTLVLIVLLVFGMASYAERNTEGGMDTVFLVGIVLTLVLFGVIAVHAVVMDVWQIVMTRQARYSAVDERVARVVAQLEREALDFDADRARRTDSFLSQLTPPGAGTGAKGSRRDTFALEDMSHVRLSSSSSA